MHIVTDGRGQTDRRTVRQYQGKNPFQDCTTDIQINTHRPTYLLYLSDLLQFRTSSRHLRSSDHCLLHDAGARTVFAAVARSVMLLR